MRLDINHQKKTVSLWFGRGEDAHAPLPIGLMQTLGRYRHMHYNICLFESGSQDLFQLMTGLLDRQQ